MAEEWKAIDDVPGYEVSSEGRVRSIARTLAVGSSWRSQQYLRSNPGKILRLHFAKNGYAGIYLYPLTRRRMVSRLVCKAFHGEPPTPDCHADHINGVRSDNRATNLRWLSPDQNRQLRKFAVGSANGAAKLTDKQIEDIRHACQRPFAWGDKHKLDAALANRFQVSETTIRNIRIGKVWIRTTRTSEEQAA
jgi:hypothetical protein